jgi:hypothetical protein
VHGLQWRLHRDLTPARKRDIQYPEVARVTYDSHMSASDAAPLPRLGEVFFDVRGSSRSMRLSWYADTGVAVFSIWQGGVCTGTFRLPIDDLPRMVEMLQRGPTGHARPAPADRYGKVGPDPYGKAGGDPYGETAVVNQPAYPDRPDYPTGGYPQPADFDPGYQYDQPAEDHFIDSVARTDHGPDRFVPPYVRSSGDPYPIDNPGDERQYQGDYGQHAFRHDPQLGPSETQQYPEAQWTSGGYSEDPRYPIPPDRSRGGYSPGPAGEDPGGPLDWPEDDEADLPEAGNEGWQHDYRGHRAR